MKMNRGYGWIKRSFIVTTIACVSYAVSYAVSNTSTNSYIPPTPAYASTPASAQAPFQTTRKIEGTIKDGRYHASNGWFSIGIPEYAEPCYVEDDYLDGRLCDVAFFNDYGYLLKVEVDELLPEVRSIISKHHDVKDEVLDALFYDAILPQIRHEVPKVEVLHERKVILDNGEPALYAVLNLPKSSSIYDRSTGMSFDSKRGYLLVFSNNRHLVNLSLQDTYSLMPRFAETAKVHLNDRLFKHLIEVQKTYQSR